MANSSLENRQVLVTGVGIKPTEFVFHDIITSQPSHTAITAEGVEYKANIGAATALECARAGATVHMIARTQGKLEIVKGWIEREVPGAEVSYSALDINDEQSLKQVVESIPEDKPLYWVQSVGLGAGTMQLKDDNPYLLIPDIGDELLEAELSVLKNTVKLLQLLLPRFQKQVETRVAVVSSMSAIRSFASGSIHNAAKGAISRFTNAAMIELAPQKVFITDIRPGGVDTGLYDSKKVQDTIIGVVKTYGYDWSKGIRLMSPISVAKAIVTVLASEGHITSINMVARGQFPNEGS